SGSCYRAHTMIDTMRHDHRAPDGRQASGEQAGPEWGTRRGPRKGLSSCPRTASPNWSVTKRVPNSMPLNPTMSRCLALLRPTRRSLLLRLSIALMVGLSLAGCSGGVLEPRGPIGAANLKIMYNALAIMLAIVLPTIGATLVFAWWFRASNPRALYRPDWVYSGRIELLVWGIPLLVIVFLAGVIW